MVRPQASVGDPLRHFANMRTVSAKSLGKIASDRFRSASMKDLGVLRADAAWSIEGPVVIEKILRLWVSKTHATIGDASCGGFRALLQLRGSDRTMSRHLS